MPKVVTFSPGDVVRPMAQWDDPDFGTVSASEGGGRGPGHSTGEPAPFSVAGGGAGRPRVSSSAKPSQISGNRIDY